MTTRKYWPLHAEDARIDALALLDDIRFLQLRLEEAILRDDKLEALRLNLAINKKRMRASHLLRLAKTGQAEYEEEGEL
jgi:hypothetical protein